MDGVWYRLNDHEREEDGGGVEWGNRLHLEISPSDIPSHFGHRGHFHATHISTAGCTFRQCTLQKNLERVFISGCDRCIVCAKEITVYG